MIKFLDLRGQYSSIKDEIDAAIAATIESCGFIGGQAVSGFESAFAEYQGAAHCIGVGNGTDALEILIEALDLPPRSEIIVPANSFIASAEAVTRSGHDVVFCDYDPANMTLDAGDAERRISERTAAIVAVHLYGHPCDMDPILRLAEQHQLAVIEDAAQAHGAEYRGRRVGAIGTGGTFSFFPGKNLGAYGDGGAITTDNTALAEKCRRLANHGRLGKFDHDVVGRNSRLDALQAAILSVKLGHLDDWTERRIQVAGRYRDRLRACPAIVLPEESDWARQVYHLFVIRCRDRDALRSHLADHGIATGVHYPSSIPKTAAYGNSKHFDESMLANTEDESLLSLPIGEHMDDAAVDTVCDEILRFYR
jgi:dTDP-4-amino-4,6-dideoxygalactose transaminase